MDEDAGEGRWLLVWVGLGLHVGLNLEMFMVSV